MGSLWEGGATGRSTLEDGEMVTKKWGNVVLFGTSDFAACPVVLKRLEGTGTDTLVNPAGMKNDFTLFTGILTEEILARLLVRIDWDVYERGGSSCVRWRLA